MDHGNDSVLANNNFDNVVIIESCARIFNFKRSERLVELQINGRIIGTRIQFNMGIYCSTSDCKMPCQRRFIMTPTEKHHLLEKVLWALKVPEILSTAASIIGFVVYGFGLIPVEVLFLAFGIRLALFPVRIGIVKIKRGMEKKYNLARNTYTPTIIKRGTKKVEFIRYK